MTIPKLNMFTINPKTRQPFGVWKCAPCLEEEPWPVEELMTIISGVVNVTYKSSGSTETYAAGDSFYIPKGEDVIWEIKETLIKFFMRG